jgi:hypothetical protein
VGTVISRIEEQDLKVSRGNERIERNQFATRQIRGGGTKPQIVSND